MKLRNKGSLIEYDVPSEVGRNLVASGLAEEVKVVKEVRKPNLQWWAREGMFTADYQHTPMITFKCHCGANGFTDSQQGTAHKTVKVIHCGLIETCPDDVAAEYQALYAKWKARSRRPAKVAVSAWDKNPRNLQITGVQDLGKV